MSSAGTGSSIDHEKLGGWVAHAYSTADGKLLRKFWVPDVRRFDLAPDGKTAVVEYTHVYDLSTGKAMRATLRNGPTVGFLNGVTQVATFGYQGGPHPIVVTDLTTAIAVGTVAGLAMRLVRRDAEPEEWTPSDRSKL